MLSVKVIFCTVISQGKKRQIIHKNVELMFGIDVGSLPSDCVGIPEPCNIYVKDFRRPISSCNNISQEDLAAGVLYYL